MPHGRHQCRTIDGEHGYTSHHVTCPLPALISVVGLVRAWVPAGGDPYRSVSPTCHKPRVRPSRGKTVLWEVSPTNPRPSGGLATPGIDAVAIPPPQKRHASISRGEVSSRLALPAGAVPLFVRHPNTASSIELRASRLAVARNRIFGALTNLKKV